MSEEAMFQRAVEAIRQRNYPLGRDLLTCLLKANKNNPHYWLWMSAVVETVKEQIYCLEMTLRLDKQNVTARRGLILLGALPPDDQIKSKPLIQRKWEIGLEQDPSRRGLLDVLLNPLTRAGFILLAGIGVIAVILLGVIGSEKNAIQTAVKPTMTTNALQTYTYTPTFIGEIAVAEGTRSPNTDQPLPLWMMLEATYTPTPFYVNTPHPISEAYRAGQFALSQGDLDAAWEFFRQAASLEPDAADIYYYLGEIDRLEGNCLAALKTYNDAISINSSFAPLYLGRARCTLALDSKANILQDLQQAISLDKYLAEAYLERIVYNSLHNNIESTEKDLQVVEKLLPHSPLPYLYRAQLSINHGDGEVAFQAAQRAYQLDRTLLPVYLTLSEAALMNADFFTATEMINTYLEYDQQNANAWLIRGRAYAGFGEESLVYGVLMVSHVEREYQSALEAFEKAINLDSQLPGIFLYRGLTYLALGEGQKAVNDLLIARRLEAANTSGNMKDSLWFAINLGIGRALHDANRSMDAYEQINSTENLAMTDEEKAAFFFWRAKVLEALGNKIAAQKDWQSLLNLPRDEISEYWVRQSEQHLATLMAPTMTLTPNTLQIPSPLPMVTSLP